MAGICELSHHHGAMCSFVVLFLVLCTMFESGSCTAGTDSICFNSTLSLRKEVGDCLLDLFDKYGAQSGELNYQEFSRMVYNMGLGQKHNLTVVEPSLTEDDALFISPPSKMGKSKVKGSKQRREIPEDEDLGMGLASEMHVNHIDHHIQQDFHRSECLSPRRLFNIFEKPISEGLSHEQLWQICPVLLQQLDSQACITRDNFDETIILEGTKMEMDITTLSSTEGGDAIGPTAASNTQSEINSTFEVWLYAICAITVISLASLSCIVTVPCIQRFPKAYYRLLAFLVAMAVGTLAGDAVLHLIPHAIIPHNHDASAKSTIHSTDGPLSAETLYSEQEIVLKGFTILMGIFLFFLFEQFLHSCNSQHSHGKEHHVSGHEDVPSSPVFPVSQRKVGAKLCHHNHHHHHHHHDQHNPECIPMMCSPQKELEDPPFGNLEKQDDMYLNSQNNASSQVHVHNDIQKDPLTIVVPSDSTKYSEDLFPSVCTQQHAEVDCEPPALLLLKRLSVTGDDHCPHDHVCPMSSNSNEIDGHVIVQKKCSENQSVLSHSNNTANGHSHSHGHSHDGGCRGIQSLAWVVVLGDGMHNFCDGLVIGAAFVDSFAGGFSTAVAIMCHEIPHELGDFAVMLKSGMSVKQALAFQGVSSVLAYMGMALGVMLGNVSEATTWLFGLAAGMFLYIALVDLFPEMVNSASYSKDNKLIHLLLQVGGVSIGVAIMLVIALCEDALLAALG